MTASYIRKGRGPAIIFLHGVGSGKEGWHHQMQPVVKAGWQFVAVDAPGFGDTPLPSKPGFEPHVAGVLELMDELELQTAVLCGHSMGGMTAQEVIAQYPDRVDGLILSATSPAFGRKDGEFQKKFLRDRLAPLEDGMQMPELARLIAPHLLGPSPDTACIEEIISVMERVSTDAYRYAMHTIAGFDRREDLARIAVATLLIAGDADKNAPAPMMEKMASRIGGAEFVCLADTGHMAPIENSAAFNQHVMRFLGRVSKK